jgi:hypothetical protein
MTGARATPSGAQVARSEGEFPIIPQLAAVRKCVREALFRREIVQKSGGGTSRRARCGVRGV